MTEILDSSGRSVALSRLLTGLMAWTSNARILQHMKDAGRMSLQQALVLCYRVDRTAHPDRYTATPQIQPLSTDEIVVSVLQFIDDRQVRRTVGRETAKLAGPDTGASIKGVTRDLFRLKLDLHREYRPEERQAAALDAARIRRESGLVLPN